ncbi:MAG: pyridoxal phosphate-dependent aminotransferase [Bacteroidota bacterium]
MPSISTRGKNVPLSPFRKLIPYADAAKARGTKVYHLNIGQPDIVTPPNAVAALQAAEIEILAYSPAIGIDSYRAGLQQYYQSFNIAVEKEDIIVTTGASEALQFLMYACFNRADEIIVPEPFYANYNGFAQIADVQLRPITCTLETGFELPSIADFERVITPSTKAIFITNPNNPTGCFYSEKVLRQLGKLVKDYDLYLIADEVYREFCYDDNNFFSVLNLEGLEDHVVVVDSVSKRYSACGARVGAIVTRNEDLKTAITKYAKLRLSPPGLGQMLAEAMLQDTEGYMKEVHQEYDSRRKVVFRRLQAMKDVVSYLPGGAFYCFAKFPVESTEHFCQWLLTDFEYEGSTVMLSPGQGFYATPGLGLQEARIAYVLNPAKLEKAMDCLEKALEVYPYKVNQACLKEVVENHRF